MTGRRRLLLSAGFLGSVWLLPGPAAAQPRPQPAAKEMTPEQIRVVLDRLGGLPPEINPAVKDLLRQQFEKHFRKTDPKELEEMTRKVFENPTWRKMLEDQIARRRENPGKAGPLPELQDDLKRALKNFAAGKNKDAPGPLPSLPPGIITPDRALPNVPGLPAPGRLPVNPGFPNTPIPGLPPPGAQTPPANPEAPDLPPPVAEPFKGIDPFVDPAERQQDRAMRAAAELWERNLGPLDETPALKRALFDLVAGTEGFTDANGNNLWDSLGKETGDGTGFAEWLEKAAAGENWKLPPLDLGSTSLGRLWSGGNVGGGSGPDTSGWFSGSSPRGGSVGSVGGLGGLEGSWLPVVLLAAVLLGGLVWWRFWYLRDPVRSGFERPEWLGAWPVDPRSIATREDLVRAFEYLSVLICGREARTWTHGTIARALAGLAATHGETALLLARLYELARYAPRDEPLTRDELAEGRRIVCQLAGVSGA